MWSMKKMANPEERKQVIRQYLEDKGFPENAIPAIMGNIEVETGGTFSAHTKQKGGPAKGMFQFDPTGPMYKDYYKNYLGKNKDNMFQQIDYFWDTTYGDRQHVIGKGVAKQLRDSFENDSPAAITENLVNKWFRPSIPHLEKRIAATNALYMPQQEQTQAQPNTTLDELLGGFKYLGNMFNFGKP